MFNFTRRSVLIRLAPALVSLFAILFISCKSKELSTVWVPEPIQIDGDADDWSGIVLNTVGDKDNSARIGLANDSTNFYILIRFTDAGGRGLSG